MQENNENNENITYIDNSELKFQFIRQSMEITWYPILMAWIVIAFGTYGVETLFSIEHKEYWWDGFYTLFFLGAFLFQSKKFYNKKLEKYQEYLNTRIGSTEDETRTVQN